MSLESVIRKAKRVLKEKAKGRNEVRNSFWVGTDTEVDTNHKEGGLNIVLYTDTNDIQTSIEGA